MVRHLLPMSLPECYPCPCHRQQRTLGRVDSIPAVPRRGCTRLRHPLVQPLRGRFVGGTLTQGAPKRRPWAVKYNRFAVKTPSGSCAERDTSFISLTTRAARDGPAGTPCPW